jgi:hypothetical protein
MKSFESIIQFIITVLQCFIPRKWKKRAVETPPPPKPPLPLSMGAPPGTRGSNPRLHRSHTLPRTLGICLMIIGGAGGIIRFILEG